MAQQYQYHQPVDPMQNLQFYHAQYDQQQSYGQNAVSPGPAYGYQAELASGWMSALGTGGYPDEPPLLEELGVNFSHIQGKTLTVLNPLARVDQNIMDDSDLAGPILFCLLFGTFLLLSGKVQFGYIYGVALLGSITLHVVFNLMSQYGVNFIRTASVLGYCLLPLVFTSAIGILISMECVDFFFVLELIDSGFFGYALSSLAICWCTYSASAMFVAVLRLNEMRLLVAYPCALFYATFAVITVFQTK
ncbi:Protein transport protein yip1 [Neolecta irregularis DAH-3]|uniref:Protein YIP n=1 Tax=Neolecta irregularis (strain DAH-3) TaxID=1198029 RepID=A0A1U7LJW5_NEOID|nr:Protein transport protein yip1 [Neolecta irregularis DAH-3]|eukprot:OLL22842.1 Protein transport protein yip1 [Neolecta irregularis DAH-3]